MRLSFWVVFLGLLVFLSFVEPLLLKTLFKDPHQRINATFISLSITRLIIFPWQFVGLIRAVDRGFCRSLSIIQTRIIQGTMVVSVLFTLFYCVEIIQDAYINKRNVELSSAVNCVPSSYTLSVSKEKQQLHIQGDFDIGITKAVINLFEQHQSITSVLLESHGGQIYEGRGLSKFFTRNSLDTYVEKYCSSACASAFVGGNKRFLAKHGKLGFHQYKLDYSAQKKLVPFHKPEDEQKRDLELFKSRGVSASFLNKIFAKNPDQMWFPSHAELLQASVIHRLIE